MARVGLLPAVGGAGASLSADQTWTGKNIFQKGATLGNTAVDPRMPVKSSQGINPGQAGTSDHIGHLFQTIVDGPWAESTGNDPNMAWGTNFFTLFQNDQNGLAVGWGGLIEADVSAGAGVTIAKITGLQAEASFFGASAGATVTTMESLYVAPPVRKNGATAGTATNTYGMRIGPVRPSNTGATSAYALFVQGLSSTVGTGVSLFQGTMNINPQHSDDVSLIIKAPATPTTDIVQIKDSTAALKAHIGNTGLIASASRLVSFEGNAAKQVVLGDQSPANASAGVSFGTATDTLLWRKAAGVLVMSTGDVTAPASFVGQGLLFGNITTAPTAAPVGGGMIYVQGGALKYIGTSNTITTIAPA